LFNRNILFLIISELDNGQYQPASFDSIRFNSIQEIGSFSILYFEAHTNKWLNK